MAAQTSNTPKLVVKGVNDDNITQHYADYTGAWANADTMEITIPNYEVGAYVPVGYAVWTDGAGDPGARLRTVRTAAHVLLSSFDEATGKVVFTNASGGGITNPKFLFHLVATS